MMMWIIVPDFERGEKKKQQQQKWTAFNPYFLERRFTVKNEVKQPHVKAWKSKASLNT